MAVRGSRSESGLRHSALSHRKCGFVSWSHFPLFIMNRTVSLAATVLVACSYLVGRVLRWHDDDPRKKPIVVKFCGLVGFSFAALHASASLCVLTPACRRPRGRIGAARMAGPADLALDAAADQPGGRGRGGNSITCPSCPREISTQRGKVFGVGGPRRRKTGRAPASRAGCWTDW